MVQAKTIDSQQFWAKAEEHLLYSGVPSSPMIVIKTEGCWLYDSQGRKILDFTSGQMSSLIGHGHPEIAEVVTHHVKNLDHLLSNFITEPVVELAEKLSQLLPPGLDKSLFLNTGSEVTETALRMAKMATGKFEVAALSASWHGLTQTASAATFCGGHQGYGPSSVGQLVLPAPYGFRSPFKKSDGSYDWESELDYGLALMDRLSVGSLAAIIIEPILSSGGIIELPLGYLKRMQAECRKRGALLILDEAQTGVGRTGHMWAFERDGVVPDILCLSKTLGAGLPLAAVVTSKEIAKTLGEKKFLHLTTHMNDPLVASVGSKVLDIVVRDNLVRRAREAGEHLRAGLLRLQEKYWCIADVRGRGLLQGIEIVADKETRANGDKLGSAISAKAMELGLSCNIVALPGMCGVFRLAPPLIVTNEELDIGLDILDKSIGFVLSSKDWQVKEQDGLANKVPE